MRGGFNGNLPCTFLSITYNLFIEEGFAHMCHMTAVEVGEKNCGSPFSPSTHGSFKTRTQVCKLGSNHLCSQRNLARSALLYFPFPTFFTPVPGTPMSYLISATLRVSVNISAYQTRRRDFRDTICPASLNRCLHMHWNSNEGNFISNPCSTVSSQTSHVSEVWPCSFEDVKPVAAS